MAGGQRRKPRHHGTQKRPVARSKPAQLARYRQPGTTGATDWVKPVAARRTGRLPAPLQSGPGIEPAFPHSEKNFLKRLQLIPGIGYISSEQMFSL